ncbi:hypothetical protein GCM10009715_30080 [Paeniglutamicibacter psychrophenolicus]
MVQAARRGGTDIHAGALAHRFEALKNRDVLGAVGVFHPPVDMLFRRRGSGGFVGLDGIDWFLGCGVIGRHRCYRLLKQWKAEHRRCPIMNQRLVALTKRLYQFYRVSPK